MTNKAVASAASATSGTFTATLTGLTEGQTYVYQAYAVVNGTGTHASEQQTFYASGTRFFKAGGSSLPAVGTGWLELPSKTDGAQYITNTLRAGGERNYTHLYDTKMYTSLWTAYPLYASAMGSLKRPDDWSKNPNIDEKYQINLWDGSYGVDGYSRGHMIPNGSRNGIRAMQLQTFYATNSVPQRQDYFNGSIWAKLENALQGMTSSTDTVYVVTGVAFQKVGGSETVKYIKPAKDSKQCPVPNYFYKVALKVKRSGSAITDACAVGVWMEHRDYDSGETYSQFTVTVDQIEEWLGLNFFTNLPEGLQTSIQLPRCFCIVTPARPEESPLDRARVYFILHQSQTNRSWPASPLKTKYRSCTPLASFREQPTVLNPLAGSIFRVPHKGPSTASRRTSI